MNTVMVFLIDNSTVIAVTAISTTILSSLYDWNKARLAKNKHLAALIKPAKEGEVLSTEDFSAKIKQDQLTRLMKIHAIDEDKAKELQEVIEDEWQKTMAKAWKMVDEENANKLTKLK